MAVEVYYLFLNDSILREHWNRALRMRLLEKCAYSRDNCLIKLLLNSMISAPKNVVRNTLFKGIDAYWPEHIWWWIKLHDLLLSSLADCILHQPSYGRMHLHSQSSTAVTHLVLSATSKPTPKEWWGWLAVSVSGVESRPRHTRAQWNDFNHWATQTFPQNIIYSLNCWPYQNIQVQEMTVDDLSYRLSNAPCYIVKNDSCRWSLNNLPCKYVADPFNITHFPDLL